MVLHIVGVGYALLAAISFGVADFIGGYASKMHHHFQVLVYTSFIGVLTMGALALITKQNMPPVNDSALMFLGGIFGALGLAFLFKGLSIGRACVVSPVAGVVGAIIPIVYSSIFDIAPSITQGAGFFLGLLSIWLVSQHNGGNKTGKNDLAYGFLSGVSFGLFFIFLAKGNNTNVFSGLFIAKIGSLAAAVILLKANGLKIPKINLAKLAIVSGIIDAFSNVFYILAKDHTRLDIAVVLSSFYPVITVILARVILKEELSKLQIVGLVISFIAISLVSV